MVSRPKIAIIGTGIAGNVVAHKLNRDNDITVFEANDYVGGHSNTVEVVDGDTILALDTGFIVFNDRTYPNFIHLLDDLGVESQTSAMSFSVQAEDAALEYNGSTLNTLFAQRRNLVRPSFHKMVRDILRFNREAREMLRDGDPGMTLGNYLAHGRYSGEFIQHYLIPMGAAIWSAEPEMMEQMPANFFLRFFDNHGLLSIKNRPVWRVIKGGSRQYVNELVKEHRQKIRLNCPVERVERDARKVTVYARGLRPEMFDYLFFACHSNQALRLLAKPHRLERDILGEIPYQYNEAILHTDETLMPKRRLAWAAWNYHLPSDRNKRVTLTYHLNTLQGLQRGKQYFVTLNSRDLINPRKILTSIDYEHPLFTLAGVNAQQRHAEIDGLNRTYYCGAYWRYGFHEDGVVSALNALKHFNARHEDAQQHFQRAS
jgi:predicted NAD/FAD-binding protein